MNSDTKTRAQECWNLLAHLQTDEFARGGDRPVRDFLADLAEIDYEYGQPIGEAEHEYREAELAERVEARARTEFETLVAYYGVPRLMVMLADVVAHGTLETGEPF